ncbi:MAG: zf-HC2 domain-containing protein [Pirellulaceae bacterium]|jgi:anti-sigma factor RsiW|nr:zf-HC2 domain-containing protein [Pirellulaceae bacterium]
MTGRDDFADELLSAYLDGEVSSEERAQIAQRLAGSAEYRNELEALKALQAALQDLPRYRLPAEVHQRIMRDIQRLAADEVISPEPSVFEGELLSAYFDGEVSDEERQMAEHALASSPRCRRRLDDLRELDADLRLLSTFRLGDDFAARVRQRIEAGAASARRVGSESAELVQPAASLETAPGRTGWRPFAWAAIAVAAAILLIVNSTVSFRNDSEKNSPQIATIPPPTDGSSPLTLVDRRLRDRLVLVYELSVTPDGWKQGAFQRLLKRHGIHVLDAIPVPEREQRSLLACRFLQGVQSVSTDAAGDFDRVQMYFVYCPASQAEAMWEDLRNRPEGIGSFSLSLTTRKAGDGVLVRLADTCRLRQKVGRAVPLATNLGIPCRTGRQLGRFGTVSYIDPDLLLPPTSPGATALKQAEEAAGDPNAVDVTDDFPCELLFVVRNLRPLERDERPRAVSLAK